MGTPPPQNGPAHKRVSKMEQISTSPGCNAVLSWGSAVLQRRILVRLWDFALTHRRHGNWIRSPRGHRYGFGVLNESIAHARRRL